MICRSFKKAVLRIRDILRQIMIRIRIRIHGSVHWITDPNPPARLDQPKSGTNQWIGLKTCIVAIGFLFSYFVLTFLKGVQSFKALTAKSYLIINSLGGRQVVLRTLIQIV